jgi:TnpA family transposase
VPVRTIHAEENAQYFGAGRGVTLINFTSDQFTGFHGTVIPGAAREALYILDGLLEQPSGLVPRELMTDTAGYTDVVFGLFWLLGYQYSPRLADIGKTRFWRIDKHPDYGVLNTLARHRIKTELILDNWDDLLRVAGSLKFGTLSASELMRTLRSGSKPSVLTKALQQLGRISKTLYLLAYLDDPSYRRRVLTQLNRGESRHALARAIFFGMRGELRQRYRRGMEDQLGALGLVTNIVVLWNTLYMNAALDNLYRLGLDIRPEDLARLSPLDHQHINFLGRYDFSLPEPIWSDQLRPLRDPFKEELLLSV